MTDSESISFEDDYGLPDQNCVRSTQLDDKLIQKLLDENVNDEEILLELSHRDDFPHYILNPMHYNDDYLIGLTNLIRRLMKIDHESVNRWIGLEQVDRDEIVSIFSFLFKIIAEQTESFLYPEVIEYKNLKFSLYDYVTSILCAFIMTLNEDQFAEVEEFLFDKLFSSHLINALMASDILCFCCRISDAFALDMAEVLFKTLSEIWFEDVRTTTVEHQSSINVLRFTYQILLNLAKRIFKFFDKDQFGRLIESCPVQSNLMIWNDFDLKVVNINVPRNCQVIYENIYNYTKFTEKPDDSIIDILVRNFITRSNNNVDDEYDSLLHLRLLKNIKTLLNFSHFNRIILKMKNLLLQSTLTEHRLEFSIGCLKLLNTLAIVNDEKYRKFCFQNNFHQLLLALFQECNKDFVSKLYYFSTLQNILQNPLFTDVLADQLNRCIKTYLIFQIGYYQDKKCLIQDEKDIYLKQLFKTDNDNDFNVPFEARYNHIDKEIDDIPIDQLFFNHFIRTKQNENPLVMKNENHLINEFRLFIEKLKNIDFVNQEEEERQEFMLLYNELGEIFKQK
ncbi:hypothetical protein DERP_013017 [Dermatophagoides pteronyssinus]|uniref:Uncharacterized protein n=1 Tax=Dermatophagoides pteronyssinus TaxID=6956 RepID=A0ABQ8JPR3_DERPT|nr:hypothetical protein DERP_013017 [Dermatophagoides pteronyssinus]